MTGHRGHTAHNGSRGRRPGGTGSVLLTRHRELRGMDLITLWCGCHKSARGKWLSGASGRDNSGHGVFLVCLSVSAFGQQHHQIDKSLMVTFFDEN